MEIMCINKYTENHIYYDIPKKGKGARYEIYIVPKGEASFLLFSPSLLNFL